MYINSMLPEDIERSTFSNKRERFYLSQTYRPFLSAEQVQILYNYYVKSVKNIVKHADGYKLKWINTKNIRDSEEFLNKKDWNLSNDGCHDLFCNKINQCKNELAYDIIKRGTYFPLVLINRDTHYDIVEGRHRVNSFHQAKINYNFFSLIADYNIKENYEKDEKLSYPLVVYTPLHLKYPGPLDYDLNYKERINNHIIKNNYTIIRNIVIKEKIYTKSEMYDYIKHVGFYLRDLLFLYDFIKPATYFNRRERNNHE